MPETLRNEWSPLLPTRQTLQVGVPLLAPYETWVLVHRVLLLNLSLLIPILAIPLSLALLELLPSATPFSNSLQFVPLLEDRQAKLTLASAPPDNPVTLQLTIF